MHKVIINKLGPIKYAEIDCGKFMVLTGCQSSGKSTLAKVIYLFRTVKDEALAQFLKKQANPELSNTGRRLFKLLELALRQHFLDTFGTSQAMNPDMSIKYFYNDNINIEIKLSGQQQNVSVVFSREIIEQLNSLDDMFLQNKLLATSEEKNIIINNLNSLFNDHYSTIYIPAGRSMITLLATQLSYIYSSMDIEARRQIDLCTRSYIENILKIKHEFEHGLQGLVRTNKLTKMRNKQNLERSEQYINMILSGTYQYDNGNEKLKVSDKQFVKINFTSSGQQESLWILNLLFYYLLKDVKTFFIIEEPESHLFPEWQKSITDLIALVANAEHSMLITTHSPYVLGTINNNIYAGQLYKKAETEVDNIIPKYLHIDNVTAYFVKDGCIENCVDKEIGVIKNELIDEISGIINEEFDKLLEVEQKIKVSS